MLTLYVTSKMQIIAKMRYYYTTTRVTEKFLKILVLIRMKELESSTSPALQLNGKFFGSTVIYPS